MLLSVLFSVLLPMIMSVLLSVLLPMRLSVLFSVLLLSELLVIFPSSLIISLESSLPSVLSIDSRHPAKAEKSIKIMQNVDCVLIIILTKITFLFIISYLVKA
ncbi:MAG: Uncharacterised protein [Methanobacteriota archaeon]|nr:MAG: Uncharacterised protein [Euryarchaeota archaeon]